MNTTKTSDFQIFQFRGSFAVRITDRDGAPWFVAVDVCKVLEIANSRDAMKNLDDDERMTVAFSDGHSGKRGGAQKLNIISESGMYALIIRSNKPAAREFRKWITSEVLPEIRKTGGYRIGETGAVIRDPEDDPAKRSTAALVESTNQRLAAGEHIAPHVLQYVASIARIQSGIWYRDSFGIDGRARRYEEAGDEGLPLLPGPEFDESDNRTAAKILRIVRKYGHCTIGRISVNASHTGKDAESRRRIISALVESGHLECSVNPNGRGVQYQTNEKGIQEWT